ncbi:alpha-glucosidase [Lactobacillus selangorensis]|uniref:Alpha-glucosidase n=1 Tax=Lactobacillus selangorensis TaxID=81857 RepID=A0A0R2FX11_9LACO|nr:alpha-glucosidase [Lactobacillus selangorensis]KRN28854.1 alpha-glucosidase [Lactobacillus selangorensis]KRN32736.1 alpha-glucosidase [Lactobacillus selangorensis]
MDAKWWQKAVVYQIYPRSFQDSNGDGIGDLNGITARLDYVKSLGVDVIWLNPIYPSPNVDNGYDISNYQAINPEFGTMADFEKLLAKAHSLDLKVMMDIVVNHTSDKHHWFEESRKSKDNPYRDYYIWRDPAADGGAPNNWGSYFSGSAWTYDETTKQYYLHLFAPGQPDLNWANPQVRHAVYDMMNWWVAKGVDGFRLDVINLISKPDGLPNAPQALGQPYGNVEKVVANGPHVHEYLQEMNANVMSHYNIMTVGETPGASISDAMQYADLDGKELNMVFQFEHMGLDGNEHRQYGKWSDRKVDLVALKQVLSKWQTGFYHKAWNSLYWNNHDQPRVVSRFGDDRPEYRALSAKMLGVVLHMMQGTPYIYEGEELGMTNNDFTRLDQYQDLESLNAYHDLVDQQHVFTPAQMLKYLQHHSRDNARTPMQWDATMNAGFSTAQPWLMVNPNFKDINAKEELAADDSVLQFYRQLIALRHQYDVVTDGEYAQIPGTENDESVFAYTRTDTKQRLTVIVNFTDKQFEYEDAAQPQAKLLLSNYPDDDGTTLRPFEAKIYLQARQ